MRYLGANCLQLPLSPPRTASREKRLSSRRFSLKPWAWTGSTQPPRLGYPSGIMLIWLLDMR